MNPATGETSGRPHDFVFKGTGFIVLSTFAQRTIWRVCHNDAYATKLRLRRIPRWVWFGTTRAQERFFRQQDREFERDMIRSGRMSKKRLAAWQHEAARQSETGMDSVPF